jgi:hypothetical protein
MYFPCALNIIKQPETQAQFGICVSTPFYNMHRISTAQIRAVVKHRVSSTPPIPIQHILQPFLAKPNNSRDVYNPQVKMNAAFRIRVYISDVKPSLMRHNGHNPNSTTNSMNRRLSRAFCTNLRFLFTNIRLSHPQNSNNTHSLSFSTSFAMLVVSKFSYMFIWASYPTVESNFISYVFYTSLRFP